jgi:hypothetical protein
MNRLSYFLTLVLFLVLFSCRKKDKEIETVIKTDTIKPLSYLPVYPGSYWTYSNGDTYTTSTSYLKDAYQYQGSSQTSDPVYVPFYNGVPVWGYRMHTAMVKNGLGSYDPFVTVISETLPVGALWTVAQEYHTATRAHIIAKDTIITISGKDYYPTIVLYYDVTSDRGGAPVTLPTMRRYYTRDIGLVKEESLYYGNSSVMSEFHITDYFINK